MRWSCRYIPLQSAPFHSTTILPGGSGSVLSILVPAATATPLHSVQFQSASVLSLPNTAAPIPSAYGRVPSNPFPSHTATPVHSLHLRTSPLSSVPLTSTT